MNHDDVDLGWSPELRRRLRGQSSKHNPKVAQPSYSKRDLQILALATTNNRHG